MVTSLVNHNTILGSWHLFGSSISHILCHERNLCLLKEWDVKLGGIIVPRSHLSDRQLTMTECHFCLPFQFVIWNAIHGFSTGFPSLRHLDLPLVRLYTEICSYASNAVWFAHHVKADQSREATSLKSGARGRLRWEAETPPRTGIRIAINGCKVTMAQWSLVDLEEF